MTEVGLREQKKARTRDLIAQVAGDLFHRFGYDAVTVEEVARAAQVSKKTVFNYFPTKEDLVFARVDDREAAILAAVTERRPGVTVLESFRQLCLGQTRFIERMRTPQSESFFDLVAANPPLQRRGHEIHARLTAALVAALSAESGLPESDPVLIVVAGTLIDTQRTLYRSLRGRVAEGGSDAAIARAHGRAVDRLFDQLQRGLADLPGTQR